MARDPQATRTRILDAAERLVIENGFAATSVDQVIAASQSSKGAFFHHFATKPDLARALVDRYVDADVAHLHDGLTHAHAASDDPAAQLVALLRLFEDEADELMSAQSSCLYIAVLTEQQLASTDTADRIREAVVAWREGIAELVRDALTGRGAAPTDLDAEAYADHLWVTFEGAFLLARSTGDPSHMRRQLRTFRQMTEVLLSVAEVGRAA